jgi:predicted ATP-grasp superfamily ATP-dependent carboligase
MNTVLPSAVLSGDLSMLRTFENSGIPTCVIGSDPHDIKFYSRYCQQKKIIAHHVSEPEKALEDLVVLGKTFSTKPVLFFDNDQFELFVSKHRNLLGEYYHFLLPPHELLESLVQKTRFASLAQRWEFPIPKTVSSDEIKTSDALLQRVTPPCFFKPKNSINWKKSEMIAERKKPYKGILANDRAAVDRVYDQFKNFGNDFIVQEYIPGGDDSIYSFHGYFDRHSNLLACFAGRKIRNYPREYGQSTYLELTKEPEVIRLGEELLKRIDFVGLVKIDFKKDLRTNQFYLLEVNPRATLWHHLGTVSGINLSLIAYQDILGRPCNVPKDYKTNVRWLSLGADIKGFLDYHKDGDLTLMNWLLSYCSQKVYSSFSWKDPFPCLASFGLSIKSLVKRLAKRFVA